MACIRIHSAVNSGSGSDNVDPKHCMESFKVGFKKRLHRPEETLACKENNVSRSIREEIAKKGLTKPQKCLE